MWGYVEGVCEWGMKIGYAEGVCGEVYGGDTWRVAPSNH